MVLNVLFEQFFSVCLLKMRILFFMLQYYLTLFLLFVVIYLKLHCLENLHNIHTDTHTHTKLSQTCLKRL